LSIEPKVRESRRRRRGAPTHPQASAESLDPASRRFRRPSGGVRYGGQRGGDVEQEPRALGDPAIARGRCAHTPSRLTGERYARRLDGRRPGGSPVKAMPALADADLRSRRSAHRSRDPLVRARPGRTSASRTRGRWFAERGGFPSAEAIRLEPRPAATFAPLEWRRSAAAAPDAPARRPCIGEHRCGRDVVGHRAKPYLGVGSRHDLFWPTPHLICPCLPRRSHRELSAVELLIACLARFDERNQCQRRSRGETTKRRALAAGRRRTGSRRPGRMRRTGLPIPIKDTHAGRGWPAEHKGSHGAPRGRRGERSSSSCAQDAGFVLCARTKHRHSAS